MPSVGLVGLPNVGKSSLFNLVTRAAAAVSNYPFTTIDPNLGVVAVPDPRLERLAELLSPQEVTPVHIELIDIAGLVEGASRGEGLGNRFLAHIREVDAVAHVLRCFADDQVAHVHGTIDPVRDARVVETELLLADLELLERTIEKRERSWKADPKAHVAERARLEQARESLARGTPLASVGLEPETAGELRALGLLTARPLFYVANVGDRIEAAEGLAGPLAQDGGAPPRVVPIAVRWEAELAELAPEDARAFRVELGLEAPGVPAFVTTAFEVLGLVRFYTVVHGKLRGWEVPAGTTAAAAAGEIHSDMREGFVRARVCSADELLEHGSVEAAHGKGLLRTEGRDYAIRDGDVLEILFHG